VGLVAPVRSEQWRLRQEVEEETGSETGSVVFLSGQLFGSEIQKPKTETRLQNRVQRGKQAHA